MELPNRIRLSEADGLPVKKSTLYKWSSKDKYPELFVKVGGFVYVKLDELEKMFMGK